MILDCPSCTTRFSIPDDVFAAGARKVRCAKCQHLWVVGKMDTPPPATTGLVAATGRFADVLAATDATVSFVEHPSDSTRTMWQERLRRLIGRLMLTRRQAKYVSLVLLAGILVLCGVTRHRLAARSPTMATIYSFFSVRHETAQNHLDIQLTRAEKCLVAGRDMLCIEGDVTHKGNEALAVPSIYVTALNVDGKVFTDADGKPILSWTVTPGRNKLLPGETRHFGLTEPYPDQAITDFDYGFVDDAHQSSH